MSRSIELSFDSLRESMNELIEEIVQEELEKINKLALSVEREIEEKRRAGQIPVKVGYEDAPIYVGVFCNKNSITTEQICLVEKLNREIISSLNFIFSKCNNLANTYNALKKSLPDLDEDDLQEKEDAYQDIIKKSSVNYMITHALSRDLEKVFRLKKGIQYWQEQADSFDYSLLSRYDFCAIKEEYRKLYMIYRCTKCIDEWQLENHHSYLGNSCTFGFVTEKDMDLIVKRLYDFRVKVRTVETSELKQIVLDADLNGKVDEMAIRKIGQIVCKSKV